jgi:calcineurin-like phosphoesterase family protein
MNIWFTSDLHLGHENIIKYCNRPFKNCEAMNRALITKWNQRVESDDVVYHLGDFCFKGGVEGGTNKAKYWEDQLNGKIIHIAGNHDSNNQVVSILRAAILEFGGKIILAQHVPPTMRLEVPDFCDFVLCGHVHEKWKHVWLPDTNDSVPVINIGVDQWKFMPVKLSEVMRYYQAIIKRNQ